MPKISEQKRKKITEQILFFLYSVFPESKFTAEISREIARDEEFIKKILSELEKSSLVVRIDLNSYGKKYEKRSRWRLSNKVYETYKNLNH